MKNQEKSNLIYNHYSSINLNNYLPNQRNIIPKSTSNNCNFNKINPSYNGKIQLIQNNRNFSTPNYTNSIKTNSAINLNKLNISGNNQFKNNNIPKFISTSNYFSPLPQKSKKLSNYTNLNHLKVEKNNNNIKYISSPLLKFEIPKKIYQNSNNKNKKSNKKKTLILDLDETLVHSGFNQFKRKSDIILNISIDGKNHTIYVLKRPNLDNFFKEISELFEIFIFTASISEYASPLLDELDKDNILNGRLFRQHCIYNNGLYLKDLKQIGRDLKDIIIIDNNPVSYAINQDNGIPILTWYDNINDNELNKLIPLLRYLSNVDDVRPIIKQIVNKEKNEIDFDLVGFIINNKNGEKNKDINGGNKNIDSKYTNNIINIHKYENQKYDIEDKDIYSFMNKNFQSNQFIKNFEDRNINLNNNNLYKYKDVKDSLSNMTYDEIQNEGHIENIFNENKKEFNNNNIGIYNNKNISILKRTKELFKGLKNNEKYLDNENNNYIFQNDKKSYTPNANIERKNNYYNRDNLIIKHQNNNNINNIIDKMQDNIKKAYDIHDTINNNKIFSNILDSKDRLFNGSNNINMVKHDNYLIPNEKNIYNNNNYNFQSSQNNIIIQKNDKIYKNQKIFSINKQNNKKKKEENKNINSFINSNNINNRNNDNNISIGFNFNTLNNNKLKRNPKLDNNHNNQNNIKVNNFFVKPKSIKKIKDDLNIVYNEEIERDNDKYNKIDNNDNNNSKNENKKSFIELRREKLNEIKRKMEEINNDIKQTENKLYHTQNNFKLKKEINNIDDLGFSEKIENNLIKKINKNENERQNNFQSKEDKIIYNNINNNNFNRSFSGNKNFISNNMCLNGANSHQINKIVKTNNQKEINTEDIDYLKINNKNQRVDTEISTNNNYNIDTIMNNVEKNKSTRSLIINKKTDNNNNSNDMNENYFNHTYNKGFNNYEKNFSDYDLEKENNLFENSKSKENININEIHNLNINNASIKNYNIINSLLNENKINNEFQNKLNNINGNNKLLMNKSTSNFYSNMSNNINEEGKTDKRKLKNNLIKNGVVLENNQLYNNNFKNNFGEENIQKTPLNQFQMNNLSRKKSFNNCYNFSFN